MSNLRGTRRPARKSFKKIVKVSRRNFNRLRFKTHTKARILTNEGLVVIDDLVLFESDGEPEYFRLTDIGVQVRS